MKNIIYIITVVIAFFIIGFVVALNREMDADPVFNSETEEEGNEGANMTKESRDRLTSISNKETISADDWRQAVYDINYQIKIQNGIKVDNFEGELSKITDELLKGVKIIK